MPRKRCHPESPRAFALRPTTLVPVSSREAARFLQRPEGSAARRRPSDARHEGLSVKGDRKHADCRGDTAEVCGERRRRAG